MSATAVGVTGKLEEYDVGWDAFSKKTGPGSALPLQGGIGIYINWMGLAFTSYTPFVHFNMCSYG